jgi:3-hydroxyacyl-CoA dehydrogenase
MDKRMGLFTGVTDYDDIKDVDIVIEAVFEDMPVKKQVFEKLDKVCKPGAILATNTSTLDVNEIAAVTLRPQDVLGLHFFSPANVMKLLEVVGPRRPRADTLATAMKLAKTIKKVGVVSGVCDGFIGNRMLHGYFREAGFLLEEERCRSRLQGDRGLRFCHGPFRVGDLAGLDVGWYIRKRQAATRPPHSATPRLPTRFASWALRAEDGRRLVPVRGG